MWRSRVSIERIFKSVLNYLGKLPNIEVLKISYSVKNSLKSFCFSDKVFLKEFNDAGVDSEI